MVRICLSSSLDPSFDLVSEFWRIRDLIAETAKGVRGKQKKPVNDRVKGRSSSPDTNYRDSDESSYESSDPSPEGFSLESNGTDEENRHFMVVFFDILYVDGKGLLQEPYSTRRALLKDTIREIEGFVSVLSFMLPNC
jgi:DNA ligase-4